MNNTWHLEYINDIINRKESDWGKKQSKTFSQKKEKKDD